MNPTNYITPKFIEGNAGKLFSLHYAPQNITGNSECFVIAPSFAEEMNRCRYMGTMLAQLLSRNGFGYLIVDTYGTGDSEGDSKDVGWDQNCQDLKTAFEYAHTLGYSHVSLLGVRLGALQVMQILPKLENVNRLVFWQPVINGQAALTQFLRIKIAASIGRNEKAETIGDFEKQIEQGNYLSVAGYDMSPELFKAMKEAKFLGNIETCSIPVAWFTTLTSADRKTPRSDLVLIDQWRAQGAKIDHMEIIGPPFWQAHERTLIPELVDATVKYVAGSKYEH